jgi:LPS-assembly protein
LCADPPVITESLAPGPEDEDEPIHLSADFAQALKQERFTLWGNAKARRGRQEIEAELLAYDKANDVLQAQGDIRYRQDGFLITGRSAFFSLLTRKGRLEDAHYRFEPRHARGSASSITVVGEEVARLEDASFTTCSPGDNAWYLRAGRLRLDRKSGTGVARNAWLAFKGVPVLYSPYLTFPIDERRRSGFLAPTFGTSDTSGIDLSVPYYWNIAPNQDATFTPRWLSKRGTMLRTEYRYLYPTGLGQLNVEYLPNDRLREGGRGLLAYRHQGSLLTPRLRTDVNFVQVSDTDYFEDLGNSLNVTAISHLERRGDLTYLGPFWSLTGRLQSFQTLEQTIPLSQRPYARLPQILFTATRPEGPYGSAYQLYGELVHFERKLGPVGERLDLQPVASLPLVRTAGFLIPSLKLRHTQYALHDTDPAQPASPSRTLPIFSVDSKLFFERTLSWGERSLLQTLEPRVFYLYVPFREQSDIPIFDTVRPELTFPQLFQDNRFIGADRVADARQVTLGLTTRVIDTERGVEHLSASVGQIVYFRDREVTLPGESPDTRPTSDLVGELYGAIDPGWSARAIVQWNPEETRTEKSTLYLRYSPTLGRIANMGYRRVQPDIEQAELSLLWPLSRHWRGLGRWNYSFAEARTVESTVGFGYQSCCWALWLAARRFIADELDDSNTSLFVQLELKGLTRLGKRVEELLEEDFLADRR